MAEAKEPLSGIDAFLEQDEDDIKTLIEGKTELTQEALPDEGETPPEPTPEPKPEPTPQPGEPQPAREEPTPTPEPLQTEPEPTPEPEKEKKSNAWKELRAAQRALKEKDAELEALRKAKETPAPTVPAEEEILDPIERAERAAKEAQEIAKQAKTEVEQVRHENAQQRQEREMADAVNRQEAAFIADHPDYHEALQYVGEALRNEFALDGTLDETAQHFIKNRPDLVERHATEQGIDDPEKAAEDMAFRVLLHNKRQKTVSYWLRNGKNAAEQTYRLAETMGRRVAAPAPAPATPAPEATAKDRVLKAKETAKGREQFTQKLAALDTNPAPLPKPITSREELMKMDEKDMDRLIDEMDRKDPSWFDRLE